MTKGRILVVTHYWPPHTGGIETVAVEQARRLSDRGWDVTVATSRLEGDPGHERYGSVAVHRFRCVNTLERTLSVPVPLMSPTMLTFVLGEARRSDVVVTHGHVYLGALYSALAARRAGRPLLVIQHSPFVDYGPAINVLEKAADRSIGRFVLSTATRIVAVSEFTAAFVRSLVPDAAIDVVQSGVDTDRFHAGRVDPRRERPRVVTIRRLVPRNGVDRLVEAWRSSCLGERADLVIGGAGPEMEHIQELSAGDPSIDLLGYVPDDELPGVYGQADLFVLPSRSGEGFGLVVLEAMACGLPVIATASGGVVDIVEDGFNGRLVRPDDAAALSEGIAELVDNAEMRSRLREGALASAGASSWERSVDRLEQSLVKAMAE
jgi:D-inositol-3-phosphate glycosyltransferase